MFTEMKRPYKNSRPEDTIKKIKKILNDIGLSPIQTYQGNPYPEIYSMRLELPSEVGGFGTNGKGRTVEYSNASGYAEFMERLQNNAFGTLSRTMINSVKEKFGFRYVPDEKYMSKEEVLKLPRIIIDDMVMYEKTGRDEFINAYFKQLELNNLEGMTSVPFYDTKNKTLIDIPFNLILMTIGSNGMAAGNTFMEAVFQGLCELMERWGAAEVYYRQLTPPSVPRSFLRNFEKEYRLIENIEKNGEYKVVVKDFSAEKMIPSIGVIITNSEGSKYKLNVGSDTAFQSALSRCLTEIYQGLESPEIFEAALMDIPTEVPAYFKDESWESKVKRYNRFSEFTATGDGMYPPSLFEENPDYDFDPDLFNCKESYEDEVNSMLKMLHEQGHNVYIRDNSYLGFPSVVVYIPEISAMGRKNNTVENPIDRFNMFEIDKIEKDIFNIENITIDRMREIDRRLAEFDFGITLEEMFNIELAGIKGKGRVDVNFFLSLLRYRIGEYDGAIESLEKFGKTQITNQEYYKIAVEYMKLKRAIVGHDEIQKSLETTERNLELVEEVCEDLKNPEKIFQYIGIPKCPDCANCKIESECLSKGYIEICGKLYPKMKENLINQISIKDMLA